MEAAARSISLAADITVHTDDGVTTITLDRPHKKNALTSGIYIALTALLPKLATDDATRVVLLQGHDGFFTAGADLNEFHAAGVPGSNPRELHARRFMLALADFPKPIVAAIQGLAVGLGVTILPHCDLAYVAEDAKLSAPFGRLGVCPEAGSGLLLTAIIGHARAFALFALAETISGKTAAEWGLVNAALPSDQVKAKALEAARTLASRPPGAIRATKALMRDVEAIKAQIVRESEQFEKLLRTPESHAVFDAFLKPKPA